MKKTLFLFVFTAMFFGVSVNAQNLIPDFKNQPYAISTDGSSLIKLEKQTTEMKSKMKALGYGGKSDYINLIPATSPVVLKPDNLSFVIKVEDDVDPETIFYITKCAVNKKNRQVELKRTSAFAEYGAGGRSTKKDQIGYTVEKIADNVYKIIPSNVEAGEYAFINIAQGASGSTNSIVYSFGIK